MSQETSVKTSRSWNLCDVIAKGNSCTVVLIQNNEDSVYSVAKISRAGSGKSSFYSLENEARIHRELSHPRIIKYEAYQNDLALTDAEGMQVMVTALRTEYAPVGDLFDLLCSFEQMPLTVARFYAIQMVEAISYLHEEKKIAHRDIKLENFLIDAKFGAKLTDFELSCKTDKEEKLTEKVGTYNYLAPEQHEEGPYNCFEVDVFSLGISIFMLSAGRKPFETATKDDDFYVHFVNEEEGKFWEKHEELVDFPSKRPFFQQSFRELINGMLSYRNSSRMTIKEVIRHPWLECPPKVFEKCGEVVAEFFKKKM